MLPPPVACESKQHQEQIDEVEIQRQRADDGVGAGVAGWEGEGHPLEALRVVRGESGEDDHADEAENELEPVVLPEHSDDRRDDDPDQSHEEELTPPCEAAARDSTVEGHRAE